MAWEYVLLPNGRRVFYTFTDKLKRDVPVFRKVYWHRGRYTGEMLRAIRAAYGVGRPSVGLPWFHAQGVGGTH